MEKSKLRWNGIGGRNKPKGDKPLPAHLMKPQEEGVMDNLPKTYQAMKDYVRYSKEEIRRCNKRIKDLTDSIETLKPKIKSIEDQEGIVHEII